MSSLESRINIDPSEGERKNEEESLPSGIIIVIAGKPGVGKTLSARNFASQNGFSEPLTIGQLIRGMSKIPKDAVSFNPSERSPKVDRKYDEIAIEAIKKHPVDAKPLVVESDLGVWHAEEAIKRGLDPDRVITIILDASEKATGIRVLKRKQHLDPENASADEIQKAYKEVSERNKMDRDNWENVYKGEVGDPYDENRFDVLINTDKHNENGMIFDVSEAIKKAVFAVLIRRFKKVFRVC